MLWPCLREPKPSLPEVAYCRVLKRLCTTIPIKIGQAVYMEYVRILSKIMFYLLQDGCRLSWVL